MVIVNTDVLNHFYKIANCGSEDDRWDISHYIKSLILLNSYPDHRKYDLIALSGVDNNTLMPF